MATLPSKIMAPVELGWKPEDLPPFPAIAVRALHLVSGTDTSLLELCDLIRSDPAFSTAVLRIANSPLVAFSKNITSVVQASMLLGFGRLKSVVVTVGLRSYLKNCYSPLLTSTWRHSVACAIIAQRAARLCGFDKEFSYTAGVMHDIGRVAMATALPEEYAHAMQRRANRPLDVLRTERDVFGVDHCQAGRSLAALWGLPTAFLETIASHHDLASCHWGAPYILGPSCLLADSLGFAVVRYRAPQGYSDVLAHFPELARHGLPALGKDLAAEIKTKIELMESV